MALAAVVATVVVKGSMATPGPRLAPWVLAIMAAGAACKREVKRQGVTVKKKSR